MGKQRIHEIGLSPPEPKTPGYGVEQQATTTRATQPLLRSPRPAGTGVPSPGPATAAALSRRGNGRPLPLSTRARMERALGADLSGVRTHVDAGAASAAEELGATAFTSGRDIYFGASHPAVGQEGERLLSHELVHTVQQSDAHDGRRNAGRPTGGTAPTVTPPSAPLERQAETVAEGVASDRPAGPGAITPAPTGQAVLSRQAATPAARPAIPSATRDGTAASNVAVAPGAPGEPVSLDTATFTPSPVMAEYIEGKKGGVADVPVHLGNNLAMGTIKVRKRKENYSTSGAEWQGISLVHPLLAPLSTLGVVPVLAVKVERNAISGYATVARGEDPKKFLGSSSALLERIKENSDALGWTGFSFPRFPKTKNALENGVLVLQVENFSFRLGGFLEGKGTFGLANDAVTFSADTTIKIPGLSEAPFHVSRDETGLLAAQIEIPVTFDRFSGSILAKYAGGVVDIRGTVRYRDEKFSGEITLLVTDPATARDVAIQQLGPEAVQAASEEQAGAGKEQAAAGKGQKRRAKEGARALAGWGVLDFAFTDWLSGKAMVIVDGEGHITVVGEIRPQAEYLLFDEKPFEENIFALEVRASYGLPYVGSLDLFAGIGLDALATMGPGRITNILVCGRYSTDPRVFNEFAIQGTLNISAFAGLRLKAEGGLGVTILKHRIKAGVGLSALAGVRGYVEATPTFGYREKADPEEGKAGEFYFKGHMELAAQPFLGLAGELFIELKTPWWSPVSDDRWSWPIGSLEYPLPGEFGLGADVEHVIGSGKIPQVQLGKVSFNKEKFMSDLLDDNVPKKSKGEQQKKGEWKEAEVTQAPPEPQLVDGQGAPSGARPPTGKQRTGKEQVPSPELQQRWLNGMGALGRLAEESKTDPLNGVEIRVALAALRRQYGFTRLTPSRRGEDWRVHAVMNPEGDIPMEGELGPGEKPGEAPAEAPTAAPPAAEGKTVKVKGEKFGEEFEEEFVVFRVTDEKFTIDTTDVELPRRKSEIIRTAILKETLGIEEHVALALLREIHKLGRLLLTFARAKGGQDPLVFLRGRLESGFINMAAVGGPVTAAQRSKLVYLGEDLEPLANVALVFHEVKYGQFEETLHPEAKGIMEYNYREQGARVTTRVWPRGIVRVDDNGVIVEILAYHEDLPEGPATLERLMKEAGWKLDLPGRP